MSLEGKDHALRWPPSPCNEGLGPEPFKLLIPPRPVQAFSLEWRMEERPRTKGGLKGAGMWQPDSEPGEFPFPLTSSTNRQPQGCPQRLELAHQGRGLGLCQRRPLRAVNTALSLLFADGVTPWRPLQHRTWGHEEGQQTSR